MAKLSSALVLNKFILNLFGVKDLEALSENLKDSVLEGYDENNVSHFYHELITRFYANPNMPKELLYQYDQNIYSHTKAISEKRSEPIKWKYFQYLSLLFTEIYLDRYFSDRDKVQTGLNSYLSERFIKERDAYQDHTPFTVNDSRNDLNKLAYWNATGSGKTLLMHVNILQYRHYLEKHGRGRELNRIIVLTPNEGLSRQHLKEFQESGMSAELFDKNAGGLFQGKKIEIIDIHKLEEKSGEKTVAIESFEGNNLVLVDEGHRGSGGDIWKDKRNRICEAGFSFEYSATFGQAVNALSGARQRALTDEYGKAIIFDYSYKYFYGDGYGKDYQILNLSEDWNAGYVELYLTACLLSFYEQLLVFKDNGQDIQPFLIEKPLAIFVGSKVTAVRTEQGHSVSDVIQVLKFFEAFVKNPANSIQNIDRILTNRDGLNDQNGHSIFRNSLKQLRSKGTTAEAVFNDILLEVFNSDISGAFLHLDNLKGHDGEIGLRIGNADYFGVINVGDDSKLIRLCEEQGISTDEKDFSTSLFHSINAKGSKINILIGSKKFSEGWSSWRVSIMGLLNIGRGEGSEIIQLFGRGVRLKGYKTSLKRSAALDYSIRPDQIPTILPILETLNIFGIRADYMQQFKELLEEEGLPTESDFEKFTLDIMPVIDNLSEKKLKYIKVKDGANFKKDVLVDAVLSDKKQPVFLDWSRIFFEIEKFKNERSWYNLNLSKEDLKAILNETSWYTLYIPTAELELREYSQVKSWQEICIALLKSFCERVYQFSRQNYYKDKFEVCILDSNHPNFIKEYELLVKKSEHVLIGKINALKETIKKKEFKETCQIDKDFEAIYSQQHLYYPLLFMGNRNYQEVIKIQPVALNKGERNFIEDLKAFHTDNAGFFESKELYLLRNLSRKGIGFFEANNFYPDFILWLVEGDKQFVTFIDPKGLRQTQGVQDSKIQLHKTIKTTIQPKLNDPDIELNSFIISNTPYGQISHWRGQERLEDFNLHNVLFQVEQKGKYIELMLEKMIRVN